MVKLIRGVTNAEMLRRNTNNHNDSARSSITPPDDGQPEFHMQSLLPPTGLVGMKIENSAKQESKRKNPRIQPSAGKSG
jgi:hypothetical protein